MSKRATRRLAYGLAGLGLAVLAIRLVIVSRSGGWVAVTFALAPDLPLFIGGRGENGRISPRAVKFYNATHRLVGPAVLAIGASGLGSAWLVGALAWAAHIALDRSLGFELRSPDGSPREEPLRRRPVVRAVVALMVLAVGAGIVYEALSAQKDQERYPVPGSLVVVGDLVLHLHCMGNGEPTVVLESGLGESSLTWALVQPELAATTRVCSYDRAGYGWSEPGPAPRTPAREAEELRALLMSAGEPGPYVLAAHSIGANVTRLFVQRYPADVAGVVLVDPTEAEAVVRAGRPILPIAQFRLSSLLARAGLIRLFGRSLVPAMLGANPPAAVMQALPVLYGPQTLGTAAAELEASMDGARDVIRGTSPGFWGDLPLVVITAGVGGDPGHGEDLAALSSTGEHRVAEGSGHYVHYERPQVVIDSINDIVEGRRGSMSIGRGRG